jgi:hypothetical protein
MNAPRRRALPPPHPSTVGGWVEPLTFNRAQRAVLSAYLDADAVERLRGACELQRGMLGCRDDWPTIGEVRAGLAEIADCAEILAGRLARNNASVEAELAVVGQKLMRDWQWADKLAEQLLELARQCDARADKLPAQSRPAAPVGALRPIAEILEAQGIKVSASPQSRFLKIARECFHAMGLSSPDHAARLLVDEMRTAAR